MQMTDKSIEKIIANFPSKDWFIDILHDDISEVLPKNIITTIETVITRVYLNENVASCNYELDVIYQLSWEQINVGMYESVPKKWRQIFAISCLLFVFIDLKRQLESIDFTLLKRCLYLCDMSLMMGGELVEDLNIGSLIASDIHGIISDKNTVIIDENHLLKESNFDPYKFIPSEIRENTKPLRRIEFPSISEFLSILQNDQPVILTHLIDDWPALSTNKWSVNSIRRICGYRTVPMEIGSTYADADWCQKLMTINEFVDDYFHDNADNRKAYLAQHYLFSQIAELNNDIRIPDFCLMNGSHEDVAVDINAWFGPSGTVSPLHQDPKHNFLCQVFGEKYVKLYPSSETDYLYPNSTTMLKNTSKIDVFNPDLESFPLFNKAKGYDALLKPGEVLFIPPKCWHYVKSISSSFSVNFWWNYK